MLDMSASTGAPQPCRNCVSANRLQASTTTVLQICWLLGLLSWLLILKVFQAAWMQLAAQASTTTVMQQHAVGLQVSVTSDGQVAASAQEHFTCCNCLATKQAVQYCTVQYCTVQCSTVQYIMSKERGSRDVNKAVRHVHTYLSTML
jgi:hypothetical protein